MAVKLTGVGVLAMLAAGPVAAQTPQIDPKAAADRLLDALRTAPDGSASALLEAHIEALWSKQGSPAVRLLMTRAAKELQAGADQDAAADFDAAITLDDAAIAAWQGRAEARNAAGDVAGAVSDLSEAVKRQPRDFAAYELLAQIAEQRRDWPAAYQAWKKVLQIAPHAEGGQSRLKELERKALGDET